ncbi:helix-turn-helix transcriptional regulator [Ruania zhangjianzhongii]|uniref:helix-turn-helix transcriptional regulator n=1 Tax=Ruania zhangjianzhongii TaxID=2603206 RepID=UPI0011CA13E3|nr:YafY family protein [Ruania zhangjianzhongii]
MLDTSARLLHLLSLLQLRQEWSGDSLASRLEVDVRTVRRDIDKLRSLGYPVDSTRGTAGGYRLAAGTSMPPLLLDDEEAVAVAIGLRGAAVGAVSGVGETAVSALLKLEQVLPSRLRHRVQALHAATVSLGGGEDAVDPEMLTIIAAACRDQQRLRFRYRGSQHQREVEPLRLVHTPHRWYLVAWDVDRSGWRTYRVDRIDAPPSTGRRFTPRPPPAKDLGAYVSTAISSAPYTHQARLLLHTSAAQATARISPTVGRIEAVGEATCLLRTGSHSLDEIAIYVALMDVDFDVLDPPELAERIQTVARRLTAVTHLPSHGAN